MQKVQLLIGATSSGGGKTTFTIGLLRVLKNRGMMVQPFKCGPDYIDPKYHAVAAGEESVNLDTCMSSVSHVQEIYAFHGREADVCVTEGVMGLFDGYDGIKGSSAEIATCLNLPVILIINARSAAFSVAPLLYGFKHFYPGVRVVGAVFNFVSSTTHYAYLCQACKAAGVEALGYIHKDESLTIPSRHLGLTLDDSFDFDAFADRVASVIGHTVDVDRLLEVCTTEFNVLPEIRPEIRPKSLKISVAKDKAFNFMYRENIEALRRCGEVTFFSPLKDKELPFTEVLYLPGGYPELYLPELAANSGMLQAIREYGERGGKILAECGGMMYLCEEIRDAEGKGYPLVGLLRQRATMEKMDLKLGYRRVDWDGESFYGHEFHYSRILPGDAPLESVGQVFNAKGTPVDTLIYHYKHILASYIHFYWAELGFERWLAQI